MMGVYVNSKNESKECFLEREALEISREEFLGHSFENTEKCPLCLVENPGFSACAVANNTEDLERYSTDKRPKKYFLIDRYKLEGVVGEYGRGAGNVF